MQFTVTELVENEDGSADIKIECDADLMKLIIQEGFISILKQAIEGYKNEPKGTA
jgi:hypothetical protein